MCAIKFQELFKKNVGVAGPTKKNIRDKPYF